MKRRKSTALPKVISADTNVVDLFSKYAELKSDYQLAIGALKLVNVLKRQGKLKEIHPEPHNRLIEVKTPYIENFQKFLVEFCDIPSGLVTGNYVTYRERARQLRTRFPEKRFHFQYYHKGEKLTADLDVAPVRFGFLKRKSNEKFIKFFIKVAPFNGMEFKYFSCLPWDCTARLHTVTDFRLAFLIAARIRQIRKQLQKINKTTSLNLARKSLGDVYQVGMDTKLASKLLGHYSIELARKEIYDKVFFTPIYNNWLRRTGDEKQAKKKAYRPPGFMNKEIEDSLDRMEEAGYIIDHTANKKLGTINFIIDKRMWQLKPTT